MIRCSDIWLSFVCERFKFYLIKRDILYADETELQVLNEHGRVAGTKSYTWLYRTSAESPPIIMYDYKTTRASKNPKNFLKEFKGYLQVDGYQRVTIL